MTQRIASEAERALLRQRMQGAVIPLPLPREKAPELTAEQRLVLAQMVLDRIHERARLRVLCRDLERPWDQAYFDRVGDELTMLYVLLGEVKKTNPTFAQIKEPAKREFWRECQAEFARAKVAASKPVRELKYEPRTDPSIAFGD